MQYNLDFYDNHDGDEFIQYKNVKMNIKCSVYTICKCYT